MISAEKYMLNSIIKTVKYCNTSRNWILGECLYSSYVIQCHIKRQFLRLQLMDQLNEASFVACLRPKLSNQFESNKLSLFQQGMT